MGFLALKAKEKTMPTNTLDTFNSISYLWVRHAEGPISDWMLHQDKL